MATRPMPMPRPPRAAAENQRAATTPPSTIIAAAILPGLGPFQGVSGALWVLEVGNDGLCARGMETLVLRGSRTWLP